MAQFYTLLTQVGQAKLANAMALGEQISISQLAVGDGGGTLPTPDSDRTALVNEQRRAPINLADVDPDNPNWIVVEQVLPPDVGGWTIREIGVFDSAGDLIAYGNYPETYKPTLDEGSGRTQTVRMVLQVSDTAAVTLRVDPSVVLATRKYVDDGDKTVAQGAANALQEHVEAEEAHTAHQISIDPIDQASNSETVQQALAALGIFAGDGSQNIAVFDTAGVTNWTVPDVLRQGLRKAHVTVIGGGGGGGMGNGSPLAGGGGGGGGIAEGLFDLSDISSIAITVGTGGSPGSPQGGNGGASSFGEICSATGGGGGGNSGAQGGTGAGGSINGSFGGGGAGVPVTGKPVGGAGGGPGGSGPSTGGEPGSGQGPGGGGAGSTNGGTPGLGAPGIVIVRW